jgi:Kef-type K+ transport system membrane component KefB
MRAATTTELFLAALVLVFAVPWLVWRIFRTDYFAPLVVVQVIAGIALGPGVLGAAFPEWHKTLFTREVTGALSGVAWWAVMLFVFVAGVELDIRHAWARRRETGTAALLALSLPLATGSGAAAVLLSLGGADWIGAQGQKWQFVLGAGMACAVTALPVLLLLLDKLDILRAPLGQRILRYASLDDVAIWGVLALILLDWERLGRQAAFLPGFVLAALAMRWLMARLPVPDRWYAALVWLAVCGYAADWSGLHYMVGAFLAGAVLDAEWFETEALDHFRDAVLLALMPVYFLSTGLRTSWEVGGAAVFGAAALFIAASMAGKLAGLGIAGRILRWSKEETWVIGWLLQTKGLVMIVFANILLDKAIITGASFTALLLTAVASTMLSIPMVGPALRRNSGLRDKDL